MTSRTKAEAAPRFYRGIGAHGWSDSDYFTFSVRSPALRRWIAARLPAPPQALLSLGCGSGELEACLAALGHRVVGLDLSRPMLERAQARGLGRLVQGDCAHLPFAAASFDGVIFAESIGHLDPAASFAEAARVLKRRGRLLLTSYAGAIEAHDAYVKFGADALAAALAAAGFRLEQRGFLDARRGAVSEAPEEAAGVLYLMARKRAVTARCAAAPRAR